MLVVSFQFHVSPVIIFEFSTASHSPEVDPSCDHHLHWSSPPEYVLLMKKFCDDEVTQKFMEVARWLTEVSDSQSLIKFFG